jgi:hypothetical protein
MHFSTTIMHYNAMQWYNYMIMQHHRLHGYRYPTKKNLLTLCFACSYGLNWIYLIVNFYWFFVITVGHRLFLSLFGMFSWKERKIIVIVANKRNNLRKKQSCSFFMTEKRNLEGFPFYFKPYYCSRIKKWKYYLSFLLDSAHWKC